MLNYSVAELRHNMQIDCRQSASTELTVAARETNILQNYDEKRAKVGLTYSLSFVNISISYY